MWKRNRGRIAVSSLAALVPSVIGLILWRRLPELVPVHFNFSGQADNWAGRPFAVFALPGFFFICQLVCVFAILHDPKGENIGGKMISILLWVLPVTSMVVGMCIYASALNLKVDVAVICMTMLGVLHIVLGNVMPKLRHNYTIGIKTPWTLSDPENWYHTHRVAGWSMVTAGLLILAAALWMSPWLLLLLTVAAVILPIVYSFVYYRRHSGQ